MDEKINMDMMRWLKQDEGKKIAQGTSRNGGGRVLKGPPMSILEPPK